MKKGIFTNNLLCVSHCDKFFTLSSYFILPTILTNNHPSSYNFREIGKNQIPTQISATPDSRFSQDHTVSFSRSQSSEPQTFNNVADHMLPKVSKTWYSPPRMLEIYVCPNQAKDNTPFPRQQCKFPFSRFLKDLTILNPTAGLPLRGDQRKSKQQPTCTH